MIQVGTFEGLINWLPFISSQVVNSDLVFLLQVFVISWA